MNPKLTLEAETVERVDGMEIIVGYRVSFSFSVDAKSPYPIEVALLTALQHQAGKDRPISDFSDLNVVSVEIQ